MYTIDGGVRASGDMIVISPPLIINTAQVEEVFGCLKQALLRDGG